MLKVVFDVESDRESAEPRIPSRDWSVGIVTFHGVGDVARPLRPGESATWLSRRDFTQVLDAVASRRDVQVTIDDGNMSDVEIVLPELLRRGRIGWFFVPAGRLGTRGYLDAAGVRELVAAGMVVGCHGMHHRLWAGLPDAELHEEIVDSKRRLEDLTGRPVREAACPSGAYDRRSLALLRDAGYVQVYARDRGAARPGRWLVPRYAVRCADTPGDVVRELTRRPAPVRSIIDAARRAGRRWN